MKLTLSKAGMLACKSGFTLAESLVVTATMVLLIGGMIMANLFGVSMAVRQQIWLSASDDAGQALGKLMTDIRGATANYVGSYTGSNGLGTLGTNGGWTYCPVGTNYQQGNALLCFLGNTNWSTNIPWVIYYFDPVTANLWRTNYTGSNHGDFKLVSANPMTNSPLPNDLGGYIFQEVDYTNNTISTNMIATPIIRVTLQFSKMQNPQVVIGGTNSAIDMYIIQTYIASRNRP